jgi:hypothetical protein
MLSNQLHSQADANQHARTLQLMRMYESGDSFDLAQVRVASSARDITQITGEKIR